MTPRAFLQLTARLMTLRDEMASTPMLDPYGVECRNHWARRLSELIRDALDVRYPAPSPDDTEGGP